MTPLLLCHHWGTLEPYLAGGEGSHPQTCVGLLSTSQPCLRAASSPREHRGSLPPFAASLQLAQLKGTAALQTTSVFAVGRI